MGGGHTVGAGGKPINLLVTAGKVCLRKEHGAKGRVESDETFMKK